MTRPNVHWGEFLANHPIAKKMRDEQRKEQGLPCMEVVRYLNMATTDDEKEAILCVAGHNWDGDAGYGRMPDDNEVFTYGD